MRKALLEFLQSTGQLDLQTIILRMAVATLAGFLIYLSYMISHEGSIYSRKFNVSLMALTVITTAVMIVIGNNIALSLGMVGALSIVRFRTAIKDSRDTVYIFWTIVTGICCGSGDFLIAGIGGAFTFLILLIFGRIKMFQYFARKASLRVKNTTENSVEFIYEISKRILDKAGNTAKGNMKGKSITDAIYEIGNIEYCNMVMQNDEISS